ncbi:MAG: peptide ABC transporter substrate-binding protein [Patescibacteria group bacterium]|nr:MAG: peptide ABC transporter substrate-binding protein [Patescibacteria group bacterium]
MAILATIFFQILTYFSAILPGVSYVEGVVGQPQTFLPNQATQQTDKTVSSLIYRGLFKYDIYGSIVPDLADTWQESENGLVYTIKLKDNQYWTNGKKITADDLIYTAFNVSDLAGVATDKVDELTVRFTLPNRYAPFLNLLTVGVMPQNSVEKNDPLSPVTSGDFRVARVEKTGKYVRQITLITLNRKYDIKRIIFRYYSNEEEIVTAAKIGEINGFMLSTKKAPENFYNYEFPVQGIYYALFFNIRNEKLADVAVRQKLAKVIPVANITAGGGIAVQGPISRSVFTDLDLKFDYYDPLFSDDLEDLNLTIRVPDIERHVIMAKQIAAIWREKLDVTAKVEPINPNDIISQVIEPRDFEVLLFGQEVSRDPDRYVLWHSAQKAPPGLNFSGLDQVRADRALEEGRNELDNEKRKIHYNEFQKVVLDQVPAVFLYHPFTNFYVSKYIQGIGEKYTFTYADRFLDFENWKYVRTN